MAGRKGDRDILVKPSPHNPPRRAYAAQLDALALPPLLARVNSGRHPADLSLGRHADGAAELRVDAPIAVELVNDARDAGEMHDWVVFVVALAGRLDPGHADPHEEQAHCLAGNERGTGRVAGQGVVWREVEPDEVAAVFSTHCHVSTMLFPHDRLML